MSRKIETLRDAQLLVAELSDLYSDVRLLDAATLERIQQGSRSNPLGTELCYACAHKSKMCTNCAAKSALENHSIRCKLEYFEPDITQVTARYYELDGKPYVLELVQCMQSESIIDPDDGEHLVSEITGYNTKLYHDTLTDLYNRRYYEDIVRAMPGPAGVAVMDLDDFKVINDTCGHRAGDAALIKIADIVRRNIRQVDSLVRYGGDEFLIVMPNITLDLFKAKLERIKSQVNSANIPECPHMQISVSVGGTVQTTNETVDEAVRRADRLMYQAKNRKNRVIVASANEEEALTASSYGGSSPSSQQILIVDDSEMNRMMLSEILGKDFRILEAASGEECLAQMSQHPGDIALVLLDLVMPDMDGFEVLRFMNRNHTIEDVPVIMISSEDSEEFVRRAYELGASDYVKRPFDARVVYRRAYNTIKLYAKQNRLASMVSEQIHKREKNTSMLVGILSQSVEFRNGESGTHVLHVRVLTETLLNYLVSKTDRYSISPEEQENIPLTSALHDIGKIAIDDKILNKPGKLTNEEFAIMKKHTTYGAEMLEKLKPYYDGPLLRTAHEIARWHHERWDGRGYPDGLKGDEIPISAQIVSLADVYDALTSERCYKKAFPHEKAIQMILNGECGAFNPLLLECLQDVAPKLQETLASSEEKHN